VDLHPSKSERESTEEPMVAETVDAATGAVQRMEFLTTPRGRMYVVSNIAPNSSSAVLICSPVSADFTANYHRERLLARTLASRGISAFRFHYLGQGHSEGEAKDLTFTSICDDARDAFAFVSSSFAPAKLAVFGTRIGALVACALAQLYPVPVVGLWEPMGRPDRFFEEGGRSRRMSNLLRSADGEQKSWRQELADDGELDLLGVWVFPSLVSSLDEIDVTSLRPPLGGKTMVVDFGGSKNQVAKWLAEQDPAAKMEVLNINVAESWWFVDDHMRQDADDMVAVTVDWLARALDEVAS
jgi:pimeloyl-ACP methyl ester carboxylesterase